MKYIQARFILCAMLATSSVLVSARFTDASSRRLLVRRSIRQNAAIESLKRS